MSASLLALLAMTAGAGPPVPAAPRLDAHGDPLPAGAVARIGSVRFRHDSTAFAVAHSPDGRQLASAGYDGLRLWELLSGKLLRHVQTPEEIRQLAFLPTSPAVVACVDSRTFLLWDTTGPGGPKTTGIEATHLAVLGRTGLVALIGRSAQEVQLWDARTRSTSRAGQADHAEQEAPAGRRQADPVQHRPADPRGLRDHQARQVLQDHEGRAGRSPGLLTPAAPSCLEFIHGAARGRLPGLFLGGRGP